MKSSIHSRVRTEVKSVWTNRSTNRTVYLDVWMGLDRIVLMNHILLMLEVSIISRTIISTIQSTLNRFRTDIKPVYSVIHWSMTNLVFRMKSTVLDIHHIWDWIIKHRMTKLISIIVSIVIWMSVHVIWKRMLVKY